jgi:hypothetical protein
VKHVLQVFNRSIAAQRNVEFTFAHIGKLQIRDGKVKMRFFKYFVSAVDENAAKHIIDNMCNVREITILLLKNATSLFRDHEHAIQ